LRYDSDTNELAAGLRALTVLAAHAPLDMERFARLNRLSLQRAQAFMQTYEICGYARRNERGELYCLTPLAISVIALGQPGGLLH
jgi:DNA-binding IclR family transcriptional regulator